MLSHRTSTLAGKHVLLVAWTVTALALASAAVLLATVNRVEAAFPGKNGKIAFVSTRDGNEEIYVMDADGTNETRLTEEPERDIHPMLSPDGKRLTFTSRRPGGVQDETIYLMDPRDVDPADGSGDHLTKLNPGPPPNFMSAFSPKGERIVFVSQVGGDNEIWVMDADGTNPKQLTDNTVNDSRPVFSPNGDKIAFNRRDPNSSDPALNRLAVYIMNADGTGQTRLTGTDAAASNPSFSPDGKKIAFDSTRARNTDLFMMNPDGTGRTRLTFASSTEEFPAFSPDGKQLAFSSDRDGNSEIYVMNPEDTEATPIALTETSSPAENNRPDWGQDTTKPEITLATPAQGATYTLNQSVTADYECADDGGSGLASCEGTLADGASIDTATLGSKTFTVTATDKAGNTSSVTHAYSVIYDFQGFLSPVDNPPTSNRVKAGSAVPVKFSLAGDQGPGILAADYPKSQPIDCDSAAPVDILEQTATAGESGLSYDATTDEYTYVWKTARAWDGTCRQLVVKLHDGTVHQAVFTFE